MKEILIIVVKRKSNIILDKQNERIGKIQFYQQDFQNFKSQNIVALLQLLYSRINIVVLNIIFKNQNYNRYEVEIVVVKLLRLLMLKINVQNIPGRFNICMQNTK
eukprot:TRINITY_DN21021_c0_g1_i1.p3 TRINITY_DN21021_c0_g1~~TRINITY_DN21021_c0_g1_i1.p3  ORF type:complete len:105 (-),score=0.58 TRINITY_DN21021_c0_g1_i1:357-671(-)